MALGGGNISPNGWELAQGMIFTFHHDAPVVFPDSMRVLSSTVPRVARGSGEVVATQHWVPSLAGLNAMTPWAAYQHFKEKTKGCLEPDTVAEFVVVSENPIRIDTLRIADIEVVVKIEGGRSVYRPNEKTISHGFGLENTFVTSPKCFGVLAPVSASLIGQKLHQHCHIAQTQDLLQSREAVLVESVSLLGRTSRFRRREQGLSSQLSTLPASDLGRWTYHHKRETQQPSRNHANCYSSSRTPCRRNQISVELKYCVYRIPLIC